MALLQLCPQVQWNAAVGLDIDVTGWGHWEASAERARKPSSSFGWEGWHKLAKPAFLGSSTLSTHGTSERRGSSCAGTHALRWGHALPLKDPAPQNTAVQPHVAR